MSKKEVTAAEHVKLTQVPNVPADTIGGPDSVGIDKFWVFYEFVDGQLGRADYSLIDTYTEPNLYLLVADRVVKAITEKYGPPRRQVDWRNELFRKEPLKYGTAIAAGHLVIKNTWETDRTKIAQVTSGANFKVTLIVQYTSKSFEAALAQKEKDAQRKAF